MVINERLMNPPAMHRSKMPIQSVLRSLGLASVFEEEVKAKETKIRDPERRLSVSENRLSEISDRR